MNKDHKLMGVMVPVILILSIGVYGIPGVVGSDSNPLITAVDYKGNTTDDSSDIGSDDTDTDQSGNVSLDLQSNGDDASNTDSNSDHKVQPHLVQIPLVQTHLVQTHQFLLNQNQKINWTDIKI